MLISALVDRIEDRRILFSEQTIVHVRELVHIGRDRSLVHAEQELWREKSRVIFERSLVAFQEFCFGMVFRQSKELNLLNQILVVPPLACLFYYRFNHLDLCLLLGILIKLLGGTPLLHRSRLWVRLLYETAPLLIVGVVGLLVAEFPANFGIVPGEGDELLKLWGGLVAAVLDIRELSATTSHLET